MATATLATPIRNGQIFAEVPPEVESAVLDLLSTGEVYRRAINTPIGPRQTYAELKQASDRSFAAWRHAEHVIEEAQGGRRLAGLYPIEGKLVGFGKNGYDGLKLLVLSSAWYLNHPKSKRSK